jgi:hypothetical protein
MFPLSRAVTFTIFVLIGLVACGGGSGGGGDDDFVPTDPSTVFSLFSPGFFTQGDSDTISCSGSDNLGGRYTATVASVTQAQTTFLGTPAVPRFVQVQLTNTSSGATVNNIGTGYYSTSASDRRYLGFSDLFTTTVSATTFTIPNTALIGQFGNVGEYTDNAGNVETLSWRLDDGGNGRARRVELATEVDQFGFLIGSSTETTLINPDGTEISTTLVIFDADLGVTFTLNCS